MEVFNKTTTCTDDTLCTDQINRIIAYPVFGYKWNNTDKENVPQYWIVARTLWPLEYKETI